LEIAGKSLSWLTPNTLVENTPKKETKNVTLIEEDNDSN